MHEYKKAREAGWLTALIVIAVVLYTLFSSPTLSVRQDGSYRTVMDALSLRYVTPEDASAAVVEQFAYDDYDMGSILALDAPAVAYPAALVRLVTQPFGLNFDTRLLACVYALIIGAGAGLMVGGLRRHSRLAAGMAAICMMMLCTCTPVMCYLNSLDDLGAVIAFLLLFLGAVVHCLCQERGRGLLSAMGVMLAGTMLLRAQAHLIVLLPFVGVSVLMCMWHCRPQSMRGIFLLGCCLTLLWCGQGVAAGFKASTNIHADAVSYLAVFQGYLPVSDDVAGDLEALGLPADSAADIGRSYFEDGSVFVYDPKDGGEGQALMQHITLEKRLDFCLDHPERIQAMTDHVANHFLDAYNDRMVTSDGQTRYVRMSPLPLIGLLVPMQGSGTLNAYMLAAAVACMLCLLIVPQRTGLGKLMLCLGLMMLGLRLYLPACLVLTGLSEIIMVKVFVFFFGWLSLFTLGTAVLCLADRLLRYLSEEGAKLRTSNTVQPEERALRPRYVISRGGLIFTCLAACVLLGFWLLGGESHIGAVNNGDFGRMMEQIDLYWTEDMVYDLNAQLGTQVVEDYTYREPFHPERLTPLDPTYSLLFPSMLVRLWSFFTGGVFSTRVLAIILFAVTSLCILSILRDLHPLLGNLTLIPAICLIAMLLGENYVAWFNGLYGESMLSVGIAMTLACAVRLIMMPRGGKGSWRWLVLLAISVRMMTCSKAQMALALPGGLVLLAGLTVWHHPKGLVKLIAFTLSMVLCAGLVCWDTWGVYKKNDEVSARQTVWQSVFYGALMIADDPDAVMEELGIPPEMKADIGKHAYYPDGDYVYAPLSEEAETLFYDHVDTMTMVGYYLRHPGEFLKMLDRAAQESVTLHTGFMSYSDTLYQEHETLQRFTVWMALRPVTACRAFWQYVVLYGLGLYACARMIFSKGEGPARARLFALLFVCIMCIGAFQYPLTVVGNGFADNNKQLYCFMLCHDLLIVFAVTAAAFILRGRSQREAVPAEQTTNQNEGRVHE